MTRYILRRLLQAIPTLFGVTVLSFVIMSSVPGGPLAQYALDPKMTPAKRAVMTRTLGLDEPIFSQYLRWLIGDDWRLYDTNGDGKLETTCAVDPKTNRQKCGPDTYGTHYGILRGDLGYSFTSKRSVSSLIGERILPTLEITVLALILGATIGVVLGILSAVKRGGIFDNMTRVLSVVLSAVPVFWLGLILMMVFGAWLKVLPMGGRCDPTTVCPPLYDRIPYLVMPVLILMTGEIAGYSRYLRASMLDVINQDYIRTARAKGLTDRSIWFTHAARNALIPLATFLGPAILGLIGGAVIVETLFSWPGLGKLSIAAVNSLDYPLIMALTLIGAVTVILGYILSDILYAFIDPRIRFN